MPTDDWYAADSDDADRYDPTRTTDSTPQTAGKAPGVPREGSGPENASERDFACCEVAASVGQPMDRVAKYAEAIYADGTSVRGIERDDAERIARAVLAVADAELADLAATLDHERNVACASIQRQRVAEVERLRESIAYLGTRVAEIERMARSAHVRIDQEEGKWHG